MGQNDYRSIFIAGQSRRTAVFFFKLKNGAALYMKRITPGK